MLRVVAARDDRLVAEPADLDPAAAGGVDLLHRDRGELGVAAVAELDLLAGDVAAEVHGDQRLCDGVATGMTDGDIEAWLGVARGHQQPSAPPHPSDRI